MHLTLPVIFAEEFKMRSQWSKLGPTPHTTGIQIRRARHDTEIEHRVLVVETGLTDVQVKEGGELWEGGGHLLLGSPQGRAP